MYIYICIYIYMYIYISRNEGKHYQPTTCSLPQVNFTESSGSLAPIACPKARTTGRCPLSIRSLVNCRMPRVIVLHGAAMCCRLALQLGAAMWQKVDVSALSPQHAAHQIKLHGSYW